MNKIFYVAFILLCTHCSDIKQQNVEKNIFSELSDKAHFDLIYTCLLYTSDAADE